MAKYVMAKDGFIHEHHFAIESDTPVIVIPEADWRRLTLLVARGHEGPFSGMTGHEIDSIIQRTEEANDA